MSIYRRHWNKQRQMHTNLVMACLAYSIGQIGKAGG